MRGHHRLHTVGDELARRQGVVHPGVSHHDAVVHTDRVELERHAAGLAHRILHHAAEGLKVHVTGHDIDVRVADRDERLVEVALVPDLARRAQQGAVRGSVASSFDGVRSHAAKGKGKQDAGRNDREKQRPPPLPERASVRSRSSLPV